jgi:hypothetical protein
MVFGPPRMCYSRKLGRWVSSPIGFLIFYWNFESMRGTVREISWPRRFVADLMHASVWVPFVSLSRSIHIGPLIEARGNGPPPIGWAAIFVRAFALVAKEQPVLRTLYLKWPRPSFYELPRSVGMVAIARIQDGESCVLPQKILAPEDLTLFQIDTLIRDAKTALIEDIPTFRKIFRVMRLPLLFRRLLWAMVLNVGRQRANWFGNFGVTSTAAYGVGELYALSPGPFVLSYGVVERGQIIGVVIRWDHRVTDAVLVIKALNRLEQVLNAEIVAELNSLRLHHQASIVTN